MELISIKEACRRLSVGRTTLWQLAKKADFPRLVEVTEGRKAFVAAELDSWIKGRVAARDSAGTAK